MDNIFEYRNLLNSALSDYNEKSQTALNEYSAKVLENEGVKRAIEQITEPIGDLFLVNPVEKGVKFLGKKAGEFLKSKLDPKPQTSDNLNPESQGRSVEFENPVYDPESVDTPIEAQDAPEIADVGSSENNLFSFREVLNNRDLFRQYAQRNVPEMIPEQGQEQALEDARQNLLDNVEQFSEEDLNQISFLDEPVRPAPGSSSNRIGQLLRQNENVASDVVSNNSSASADATSSAESSGLSTGGAEAGGEGGAELSGELAGSVGASLGTETGIDLALLADPFTALFGLIAGIGTIVGGIEGAESHKNPTVPKPPPMANVSTQFGIGS